MQSVIVWDVGGTLVVDAVSFEVFVHRCLASAEIAVTALVASSLRAADEVLLRQQQGPLWRTADDEKAGDLAFAVELLRGSGASDEQRQQVAAAEVDAVIISAHGELEEGNYGALYLNEEELSAKLVGKLEAWVVYFDSCQQGVNMAYLDAFQEESDIQFYLAPIISNDAGDSSTRTMVWFFTAVLHHKQPIRALFDTRKRLFEFYDKQQKLDIVTTLNKAFPFRLYEFVDNEEGAEA
ncbi:MAG: hypothetical protein DYG89_21265 [Caldilinea sp. CFX5]|nr:hypothetical protein [Caldilinea sp. CFX5]